MEKPEYPKTLKRGAGEVVLARSAEEVSNFSVLGFAEAGDYVHQAFPKAVHKAKGLSKSVKTQEELDEALAKGWQLKPVDEDADAA